MFARIHVCDRELIQTVCDRTSRGISDGLVFACPDTWAGRAARGSPLLTAAGMDRCGAVHAERADQYERCVELRDSQTLQLNC